MNKLLERLRCLSNWICVPLTIAIVAFASPAIAVPGGDKTFSLSVEAVPVYTIPSSPTPNTPVPGTTLGAQITAPVKIVATFTNLAPPSTSSSNFSSVTLSMAVPGMSIVSGFIGPVNYSPSGTIDGVPSGNAVVTSPTSITVTNIGPVKGTKKFVLTLYVSSCGDTTWTGTANTGSQLNGDNFRLKTSAGDPSVVTLVSCGTPDCVNSQEFSVVDTTILSTDAYLTGLQGPFNSDGACGPASYFVSNLLSLNGQLHFRWPVTGAGAQPTAVFAYEITLPTPGSPKVAWLNLDGSKATSSNGTDNPVYIDPLDCLSANLPAPYGTLTNSISKTSSQIKVDTTVPTGATVTPPAPPFDIVIGLERMTVMSVTNGQWKLSARHVGGTDAATHSAGAYVMSTPLPILAADTAGILADSTAVSAANSPYKAGDQAQVCKAGPTTDNGDGTYTTPLIDIGDAYMKPPS